MPEIALQAYENEIDQLVEQARYLEALAHIRYLLSQYPRFLGAYYLLGKTMLEADLPDLALDMFRRALSADPEHRMSRIGLALSHERRNDLDAAIWNLERALELEPGSDDIAEELRRMYGRRDAVDLDYVPQTRGGLARLFLRGRRYGRAVEELRLLLQEQPSRPDLMIALAEAFWRNDQLVQASEQCQEILDKMPYNYKANLLLGSLWVNSGQEEGWIYLRRAEEVDPENGRAVAMFGADSLLEPQEVKLDRLVYDPDAIEVDRENAWFRRLEAASITVGISEAPPEMTESEVRLVDITASLESQIEIPDWLRDLGGMDEAEPAAAELGWMGDIDLAETPEVSDVAFAGLEQVTDADDGATDSETAFGFERADAVPEVEGDDTGLGWLDELASVEDVAADELGETPDWLRDLVGETEEEEGLPQEGTPQDGVLQEKVADVTDAGLEVDALGWLADFPGDADAEPAKATAPVIAGPETAEPQDFDELPDWLQELQGNVSASGAEEDAAAVEADEWPDWMMAEASGSEASVEDLAAGEIPDWLAQMQPEDVTEESDSADWLADLVSAEQSVREVEDGAFAPELLELGSIIADDEGDQSGEEEAMPDWLAGLQGITDLGVGAEDEIAPQAEEGAVEAEEGLADVDIPEWLKTFESGPSVEEDEAVIPDWLRELEPPAAEPAEAERDVALAEDDVSAWLTMAEALGDETELVAEGLGERLDGQQILPDETLMGDVFAGEDALAWLEDLTAGQAAEPLAEIAEPELEPELDLTVIEALELEAEPADTVEPAVPEAPGAEEDMLSGDDALAWLESLTIGKEEELRAQAEAESEARVAEILGRKREAVEPLAEIAEPELEPEPDLTVIEAPDVTPDFPGVLASSAPVGGSAEAVDVSPGVPEPAVSEPAVHDDSERPGGEDALTWLQSLTAEEAQALRAQVEDEIQGEAAVLTEEPTPVQEGDGYFGWFAFGGVLQEVVPTAAPVTPEVPVGDAAEPDEPIVEVSAASVETVIQESAAMEKPVASVVPARGETAERDSVETPAAPARDIPEPVIESEPVSQAPGEVSEARLEELRALVKRKRSDHVSRLELARMLLVAGEVQESMQHYGRLIKSSAKTDEVMEDLGRYVTEKPGEPAILRTMGDAYMKFGELDKALEIYNRAMNLL